MVFNKNEGLLIKLHRSVKARHVVKARQGMAWHGTIQELLVYEHGSIHFVRSLQRELQPVVVVSQGA